jgi:hypothetical protein
MKIEKKRDENRGVAPWPKCGGPATLFLGPKPPQALGGGPATPKSLKPIFHFFLGLLGVAGPPPFWPRGWLSIFIFFFFFLIFIFKKKNKN